MLRRAPLGKLLSATAHRVDREFMILKALGEYNASLPADAQDRAVPVPKVFCLCMDRDVAGAPFYVMEFLKGRIITDITMPDMPRKDREECWRSAIRTLALLATTPLDKLNLPASFAPDPVAKPYFPRQVKGMLKVSASQAQAPLPGGKGPLGDIEHTAELRPWFEAGAARVARADETHGASIVHGDYKIDNMVFHPTENRVIGVLDWELCTTGSPLADLSNMTIAFNIRPLSAAEEANRPPNVMGGLKGVSSAQSGIPDRATLEKWWVHDMNEGYAFLAAQGQRERAMWQWPIPHFEWVKSWMAFRLAIILQGIAARAALGQASSASATPRRDGMDFYGRCAYDTKKEAEQGAAKL